MPAERLEPPDTRIMMRPGVRFCLHISGDKRFERGQNGGVAACGNCQFGLQSFVCRAYFEYSLSLHRPGWRSLVLETARLRTRAHSIIRAIAAVH